ncbi:MAG TPA: RsmG family class I SAM-dependent methyltransferase [Polyangia bacterium]
MARTGDASAELAAQLAALSAQWGVPCSPAQTSQLRAFGELLLRWSGRINLTGARSAGALIKDHYPDAFALARRLDRPARVVDIGSGGGLPALPLALLRPGLTLRLIEPIAKKVSFLRTAIRELDLPGRVQVEQTRGEEVASLEARFDVAISRATFEPEAWLALGRRLVVPGGRVYVLTVPGSSVTGQVDLYGGGRRALIEVSVQQAG